MTSILQVISSTDRRGEETYATDLRDEFAARGEDPTLVALAPGLGTETLDAPTLGPRRFALRTLLLLRREAKQQGVVIAHGSSTLPACAIAMFGTRTPFVYRNIGDPLFWAGTRTRRSRVRAFLSRAAGVAAISHNTKQALIEHFGIAEEKIRVIPNGRPACRFQHPGAEQVHRLRESFLGHDRRDSPLVLYLGALTFEKRVDLAIRAIADVPDAHLVIAGHGPERPRLEHLAADLAPERIHFLGPVADPAPVLAAADAVVLPSDSEGAPGVAIEAGLTGVPVVATNVGSVHEIVVDGETGVLVPPGDTESLAKAVTHALEDKDGMGKAARVHCLARFEIGVIAGQWIEFLREVAG